MIRFLSGKLKKHAKLAKIVKISEIFKQLVFPLNFNRFCHPMTVSVPMSKAAKQGNSVLSGNIQSKAALKTHNAFSCDSIHDMGDGTLDQCQTDTDPSGCL